MSTPSNSSPSLKPRRSARRVRVAVLACATLALFASLFVQQAFNTEPWFAPASASETLILYALSTLNVIAFVVLLMVLVRNIIKLQRERREMKLGARFKTRLVGFSIALSLLPVIFLFLATTGLINRSVEKWFGMPTRTMVDNARQVQEFYLEGEEQELSATAHGLARLAARAAHDASAPPLAAMIEQEAREQRLLLAELSAPGGPVVARFAAPEQAPPGRDFQEAVRRAQHTARVSGKAQAARVVEGEDRMYLIAAAPVPESSGGTLTAATQLAPEFAARAITINRQYDEYGKLSLAQKKIKATYLLMLALLTLLILFIATWMALNVARSVAEPVRQLAHATERIKGGDLSGRAVVVGDDELAALARSFNEMAVEMEENRRRLEHSAAALDERRHYIETVLQSVSAGVISLDENRRVTTINEAAQRMLRLRHTPAHGSALEALLPEEQRDELWRMIRRAARGRSVTREVHFKLANNVMLHAAVTVTAIRDPRGKSRGAVIVIEDTTDLIEAQRRAAWSEVARRMAHEIKNPLTPIRLSAERLAKNLLGANGRAPQAAADGAGNGHAPVEAEAKVSHGLDERGARLVRECTSLIGAEVATLQRMVDEFSSFARLPAAKPALSEVNEVVADTLKLYVERTEGVELKSDLADALPTVMVDREQIKRALVNLIDNALEAMAEAQGGRQLEVITREVAEQDAVEIVVADTGPGIAPADRERIFAPYFSTRKRGTGLGLAIVSHIVAEHNGHIRVEEHQPRGARFVIELPSAKESEEPASAAHAA
jgi:two-component system, NtrC family, nitrogen regulation sensor histidine kinase NtrY